MVIARGSFQGWLLGLAGLLIASAGQSAPLEEAASLVEKENIVEHQARGGAWMDAPIGLRLSISDKVRTGEFSRAAVRFTDLTTLRMDELTIVEITAPLRSGPARTIDMKRGGAYFFSREKTPEVRIRTPAANGALRGTELALRVTERKTTVMMFEGVLELSNPQGSVLLSSGEQGEAEIGKAPHKTAVIDAVNIIQWCLYYPGVLDPAQFSSPSDSLSAYRAGDLLGALEKLPKSGRSPEAALYHAAVILSVGQVDKARAALSRVPPNHPGRKALEQMIAAVKFEEWTRAGEPQTSSDWMAESYYQQSRSHLQAALQAARKATELSPDFGFAWARVAELEFSFGRPVRAAKVLERALELAPRNAQAHALQGFVLAAENRLAAARQSFDDAIDLDGALGNAWLGRGLTAIRRGHTEEGRHDLQIAAVLEPNRSILRSYLGKAYSQEGKDSLAHRELDRAREIDPEDPTPWLYSAIQKKQENRYNEAIDDLEKSIAVNDNRSVFRSDFLLDQDRAVRGANLAAIYQNDGMTEQSIREAVRAVNDDYGSAAAHLFLANSYNALRDPTRILLRYETAWSNELLLSQLLAPVGGGSLSQFVSEQEYSKLFEKDGLGLSSLTEYFSDGTLRENGSQFGTFGNLSYALDTEYYYNDGLRPNNHISRAEGYGTFKLQLGPQDTLFLQTKVADLDTGDVFPVYDPRTAHLKTMEVRDQITGLTRIVTVPNPAVLTYDFREKQEPGLLLLGYHHEWNPGTHTLLLLGRLGNEQTLTVDDTPVTAVIRDVLSLVPPGFGLEVESGARPRNRALFDQLSTLTGRGPILGTFDPIFDLDYRSSFQVYSADLQQIITLGPDTVIFGGRYQRGQFDTEVRLSNVNNGIDPGEAALYPDPPANQSASVDLERINLYFYNVWRVTPWLSLTGGVTYDSLDYPDNFRSPPVNDRQASLNKVSPKAGVTLQPWRGATIRGSYTEAISGASFDESVRLEPTQVAGFLQAYRSVISESLIGSVAGSEYRLSGLSFEQKLPTRTYLGVEYQMLRQDLDRTMGVFDLLDANFVTLAILPSSLREKISYREDVITASANQLIGDCWSIGTRYRYTKSKLRQQLAGFGDALDRVTDAGVEDLALKADSVTQSGLHELGLFVLFNHPSGFFARGEANWYRQENDDFVTRTTLPPVGAPIGARPSFHTENVGLPGDDFWQFNVLAGYRFYRNQCELGAGVLNLTDQDYRLNPLNPYVELPRERTLVVRCRISF